MKRTPLAKKRTGPKRRTTSPRCRRQRCNAIARIEGMCISHAEKEADRLFSLWVRDRDRRCTYPEFHPTSKWATPCAGELAAAHGEPRGNHGVRFDGRNVHSLCRDHHYLVDKGSKHALKAVWLRSILGRESYDRLTEDAMVSVHRNTAIACALVWLEPLRIELEMKETA